MEEPAIDPLAAMRARLSRYQRPDSKSKPAAATAPAPAPAPAPAAAEEKKPATKLSATAKEFKFNVGATEFTPGAAAPPPPPTAPPPRPRACRWRCCGSCCA